MDATDYDRDHVDPFVYFQGEPDHSDTNFISLTSISLLLVLFIFFSLYLYTKCVQTPQARRRATIHQLTLTELAHNSTQPPNIGLDPALIAALPMFVFKPKKKKENGQSHDDDDGGASVMECAVCLSVLEDEEMAKLLPNCKHTFHVSCIDTWLASHPTCPMCRTKVQPWLELLPREGPTPTGLALNGAPMLDLGQEVSRIRPNSSSAHL